ncbi:MAG: transposase [Candidatus Shapirobacteria bacterium]|nr:transposase [Candidatus Shapirobacteria bacterium]MDD5074062.1 transposase [Candidatus Shapirobacteria bacterium]MDD5481684.1 transposase [Candidatus Shapirobacteria bacterium]
MPYRKVVFSPGEIYHLTNHGVGSQIIFKIDYDYSAFIERINFYRFQTGVRFSSFSGFSFKEKTVFLNNCRKNKKPLVKILLFELLPNHFHLVVEEAQEKGTQIFMGNLQNSHARYFNVLNKRKGPLFQSTFVAVHVVDDGQLMYLSGYVHTNAYAAFLIKKADLWNYRWSSLSSYIGLEPKYDFLEKEKVLSLFRNDKEKYKIYINQQADFHKEKAILKNSS